MTQPTSPYALNDLLVIIGQCTVELAYLRAQIAALQQQVEPSKAPVNGTSSTPIPEIVGS